MASAGEVSSRSFTCPDPRPMDWHTKAVAGPLKLPRRFPLKRTLRLSLARFAAPRTGPALIRMPEGLDGRGLSNEERKTHHVRQYQQISKPYRLSGPRSRRRQRILDPHRQCLGSRRRIWIQHPARMRPARRTNHVANRLRKESLITNRAGQQVRPN